MVYASAVSAEIVNVQVGPRPYYLVGQMVDSPLKRNLAGCAEKPLAPNKLSIGHRGAPLQFPEHTREGYVAAARMGAGILECDVTFTADGELVCRHAQCDLHATTDVLARPGLRSKCRVPPVLDNKSTLTNASSVRCCATDFTLAEFKSLCGKMEGFDPTATSLAQAAAGIPAFRTRLYDTCATLMTHTESIDLFRELGVGFAPELKAVHRTADGRALLDSSGFAASGLDPQTYADKLVNAYKSAGVNPDDVFLQSFQLADVQHWIEQHPQFGRQAVYLVDQGDPPDFQALYEKGVRFLGAPTAVLLDLDDQGAIVASPYAREARSAGLQIIAWTVERSGRIREDARARGDFYYGPIAQALEGDGQVIEIIHVLATQVGVSGIFTDWPGTVTYYASCMGGNRAPSAGGPPEP